MENRFNPITSDKELFTKVLTSPREAFHFINTRHYDKYAFILLTLAGISNAFDKASENGLGESNSLEAVILIFIIIGALFGWVTFRIYAGFISLTGGWLGASGSARDILRVLAYAMTPVVLGLIFVTLQIITFGHELFKSEASTAGGSPIAIFIFTLSQFIDALLGLYSLVLAVFAVAEVQRFSIGKAIANILLAGLVFLIPIVIIVAIIYAFK